jgi:hypothetical protein
MAAWILSISAISNPSPTINLSFRFVAASHKETLLRASLHEFAIIPIIDLALEHHAHLRRAE